MSLFYAEGDRSQAIKSPVYPRRFGWFCIYFLETKPDKTGYGFILQESGHTGQNIHLICEALDLKCCSLGGFRVSDEHIEKLLDIDGVTESLVYTLVVGK